MTTRRFIVPPPATAAQCDAEWVELRRAVIQAGRYPLRAGTGHRIEIRSNTPVEQLAGWDPLKASPWTTLILPNEAHSFATAEDRDAVLQQLLMPADPAPTHAQENR